MSGSLKPDLFFSHKLHLVENGNFILAKSIYISVKNCYGLQSNHQLNKTYKSGTTFSVNNADFPTLTPLSPRKLASDCISVSSYKSVHNSSIKPVHKPSYISFIKPVLVVVCKCPICNSSPGVRNECVHVSLIMQSVTCYRKVFKVVLPSLPVSTFSVPPVNVVKVATTTTYQYTLSSL